MVSIDKNACFFMAIISKFHFDFNHNRREKSIEEL
jgi:hypothetical protein